MARRTTLYVWAEYKTVSVISVAPVKRPKLDAPNESSAFEPERNLMMEKMRTVLRIAAFYGHRGVSVGSFGLGPFFRNPAIELAHMWKHLLFHDSDFSGLFKTFIFVFDVQQLCSEQSIKTVVTSKIKEEQEVFSKVFDPYHIFYS